MRTRPWFFALLPFVLAALPSLATSAPAPAPFAVSRASWDSLALLERAARWPQADSFATRLVARLDTHPIRDSLGLFQALSKQATYRRNRLLVRDGAAARAMDRALAIAERQHPYPAASVAWARIIAARIRVEMSHGDTALMLARRSLSDAQRVRPPDDSLVAAAHFAEGLAQRVLQEHPSARAAFERAVALMERRMGLDHAETGYMVGELGSTLLSLGEFDAARGAFERSIRIAERDTANTQRLEIAISNLSQLERRLGHLSAAVDLSVRAYDLTRRRVGENSVQALRSLANIAYRLEQLGDHARSRALLERVLPPLAEALGPGAFQVLNVRIVLAQAMINQGDTASARVALERADSLLAAGGGKDRVNAAFSRLVRSLLELEAGRVVESRSLVIASTEFGPQEPNAQANIIDMFFETLRGPADRALADSLSLALDRLSDTTTVSKTASWPITLVGRARAEARVGSRDSAWAHARVAERLAREKLVYEVEALPDRFSLLLSEAAGNPAEVLVVTARPERVEEVHEAWDRVVRRRGLVREVVESRRGVLAGGDSALNAAHARWVAAKRRHAQAVVTEAADPDDPESMARFEASRIEAEEAERLYARRAATASQPREEATLDRVLARLGSGEALAAFVETEAGTADAQLGLFVARGSDRRPSLVRLGAAEPIHSLVRAWATQLATPPPADRGRARAAERASRVAGEAVRRAVWDPIVSALGSMTVTDLQIVPDGPVLDLPWQALPDAGGHYLAEGPVRLHVRTAERELLRTPPASPAHGLLAVGDPDFDRVGARMSPGALAGGFRGLPGGCSRVEERLGPLPGAREEARSVAARWSGLAGHGPAQVLIGAEATEAAFKRAAPGRRGLHLATHGVSTRDSCARPGLEARGIGGVADVAVAATKAKRRPRPAATSAPKPKSAAPSPWLGREVWLALAGANRPVGEAADENEGWLTADEVVTLDLRGADLVVLSACQSGTAVRWTQEGVLGMRRAFHLAGARCVVASHWPISDTQTRAWMEAFYSGPSVSAGAALQGACRAVLEDRRKRGLSTHPFHWAAFTATGD